MQQPKETKENKMDRKKKDQQNWGLQGLLLVYSDAKTVQFWTPAHSNLSILLVS